MEPISGPSYGRPCIRLLPLVPDSARLAAAAAAAPRGLVRCRLPLAGLVVPAARSLSTSTSAASARVHTHTHTACHRRTDSVAANERYTTVLSQSLAHQMCTTECHGSATPGTGALDAVASVCCCRICKHHPWTTGRANFTLKNDCFRHWHYSKDAVAGQKVQGFHATHNSAQHHIPSGMQASRCVSGPSPANGSSIS